MNNPMDARDISPIYRNEVIADLQFQLRTARDTINDLREEVKTAMQDDKVFWAEVYLQTVRTGGTHEAAVSNANNAVAARKGTNG